MIKKPKAPTIADFLRADQEKIDQKYKALAEYKEKVFQSIAKEFGTENSYELVIRLAEMHHEPFKIIEKQGRKKKWTSQLEAMLAVCVDFRLEDDKPPSITDEIDWLLNATLWSKFSKKGNETEVIGTENFRKHYNAGRKSVEYEIEKERFNKDRDAWIKRLEKILFTG
jgi:hypothetical protein